MKYFFVKAVTVFLNRWSRGSNAPLSTDSTVLHTEGYRTVELSPENIVHVRTGRKDRPLRSGISQFMWKSLKVNANDVYLALHCVDTRSCRPNCSVKLCPCGTNYLIDSFRPCSTPVPALRARARRWPLPAPAWKNSAVRRSSSATAGEPATTTPTPTAFGSPPSKTTRCLRKTGAPTCSV